TDGPTRANGEIARASEGVDRRDQTGRSDWRSPRSLAVAGGAGDNRSPVVDGGLLRLMGIKRGTERQVPIRVQSEVLKMFLKDEEIQKNVLEQLKWDARIRPTEIGATVKDRVVMLVGTVDSYTKRWTAEEIALRTAGVKAVVNELEVKLPS